MRNIVARLTVVGAILSLGIAAQAQTPSFGWGDGPIKPQLISWGSRAGGGVVKPSNLTWGDGRIQPTFISWGDGRIQPKLISWGSLVGGNSLEMGISLISWGS
jgi:hypothetical protein